MPSPASGRGRPAAADLLLAACLLAIACGERLSPLRRPTQPPSRILGNLALGAASLAVVSGLEAPILHALAGRAERRRRGLAQRLPLPSWGCDLIGILLMDYTTYVWHALTHEVPLLWRLHLVHHVDLDLDASTALRFHALDMLVSIPWRAAQVALLGVSGRALRAWQAFFFLSVLFHHSNLRLPPRLDRRLSWLLTTPRMHTIHHSVVRGETNSNWSSGFSLWDRLHGSFRWDAAPREGGIGVPGYRDPAETRLARSWRMPFRRRLRDAWSAAA